jgi:hypothetical protein
MIFLFRRSNGPVIKAAIGAVLVAWGLAAHGGAVPLTLGVVLMIWADVTGISGLRRSGQAVTRRSDLFR